MKIYSNEYHYQNDLEYYNSIPDEYKDEQGFVLCDPFMNPYPCPDNKPVFFRDEDGNVWEDVFYALEEDTYEGSYSYDAVAWKICLEPTIIWT